MYESFYSLSSDPFRLLPDPGVFFPHRSSSRAWAYLRYALKRGEGIVVVTGQPGTGKTTLSERLLRESNPSKTVAVRLVAAELSATDLLRKLAYAMELPVEGKDRSMLSLMLERRMYDIERSQRRVLVVIDEAQTLSSQSLEAMRLLTDLQVQGKPVVQLVLFGQEELEGVMCTPGMEQFQQRVVAGCRLEPMDLAETKSYLEYRLAMSDWRGDPSLNGPAVLAIYRFSHGIPRHVNKICSRLFLYASSEEKHALTDRDVRTVVGDLRSELLAPSDDELQLQSNRSAGVFDSVYELALVPSAAAQQPMQGAQSESSPGSTRAATGDAPRPAHLTHKTARPQTGRSFARTLRHSVPFMLRATGKRAHGASGPAGQWMMRLPAVGAVSAIAHGLTKSSAEKLQSTARKRWPAANERLEKALQGSPFGGTWTTVGVGVALLIVVVAGITLTTGSQSSIEPDSPRLGLVADAVAQPTRTDFVLDGAVYIGAHGQTLKQAAGEGGLSLNSGYADGHVDIRLDDAGFETEQHGAVPRAGSVASDEPAELVQGQVTPIGFKVASGVVDGLSRYDSSFGVWAVAMESGERRSGDSVRRVGEEQSDANDSSAVERETVAADVSAEATDSEDVSLDAEVDLNSDMTVVVAHDKITRIDHIRFLPATASGKKSDRPDELVQTPSAFPALPEVAAVDIEIVGDSDPDIGTAMIAETGAPTTPAQVDAVDGSNPPEEIASVASPGASELDVIVAGLLTQARAAYDSDRLLMPAKRSAFTYYRKVLQLDAGNSEASRGMASIVGRYAALSRDALGKQQFDRAERFVSRGLRVDAAAPVLRRLQTELETARAQAKAEAIALAEAELARMAAKAEIEVVEVEVAPKRKPSNFRRIMNLVNGL